MPPRGVRKGSKRAHQYEHIKEGAKEQDASTDRAEEIAARTVNKERACSGESRTRSRTSTHDMSSSRRGGLRSGTSRPKGRTKEQLYAEAKKQAVQNQGYGAGSVGFLVALVVFVYLTRRKFAGTWRGWRRVRRAGDRNV